MKLPSDPADLRKLAIGVLIGLVAVGYGIKVGVFKPLNARIERLSGELKSSETRQDAARRYLQDIAPRRQSQRETAQRVAGDIADVGFVLVPRLGNYELPARQRVQEWLEAAGIEDEPQIRGRAIQTLRWPSGRKASPVFSAYPLTLSFRADLETTLRFLHILETDNPACGISSLSISANAADPQRHQVTLDLELPVWVNADAHARVQTVVSNAFSQLRLE